MNALQEYVQQLLALHPNERIFSFVFEEKKYWLKQPEQLSFVWRLLKSDPEKSFQKEIRTLRDLNAHQAPVPTMPVYGSNFFVLEDVGEAASHYLNMDIPDNQKLAIFLDCAAALYQFHQRGFIHGRPAVRDMIWHNGQIRFVDFENYQTHKPTEYLKIRDTLIFFYSLCREEGISDELLVIFWKEYQQRAPVYFWRRLRRSVKCKRWLYFLLLPLKPIAKKDLRAVYRLFESFAHIKG